MSYQQLSAWTQSGQEWRPPIVSFTILAPQMPERLPRPRTGARPIGAWQISHDSLGARGGRGGHNANRHDCKEAASATPRPTNVVSVTSRPKVDWMGDEAWKS